MRRRRSRLAPRHLVGAAGHDGRRQAQRPPGGDVRSGAGRRLPGLAVCAGMGSRGLTLAALLAETLVAQIEGTPLPIETDLADALDPARVALRRLRHGAVT